MPFIPTPGGVKVVMRYSLAGQLMTNIFHVRIEDPPAVPLFEDIAAVFKAAHSANLEAQMAETCILQAIEVVDISTEAGIGIEYTTDLPAPGTNDPVGLPNNVAVAVKLVSGLVGRSQRGRFYYGGVTNSNLDAQNSPSATLRIALNGFVTSLIENLNDLHATLVVLSLVSDGASRTEGQMTEIIGSSVNDTLDSQRRRLPERGA